jgi:hypothetical protein
VCDAMDVRVAALFTSAGAWAQNAWTAAGGRVHAVSA